MVCEHMLRESRPEVPLCFVALLAVFVLQGGFYYVLGRILPTHTPDVAGQDRGRGTAGSLTKSSPAAGRGDAVAAYGVAFGATRRRQTKVICTTTGRVALERRG